MSRTTVAFLVVALVVGLAAWLLGRGAELPPVGPERPPGQETTDWRRPRTQARQDERDAMVRWQIARRGVSDRAVLAAMRAVPRHEFVPPHLRSRAYDDCPLPIGHGQTISQPYIVAYMTEVLHLRPGEKVLEIGTGSGYQAAVLSELTPKVYTVEIIRPLAQEAAARLERLGYKTIKCRVGDGYYGWPEHAPYDAIIVTCAAGSVPPPLLKQLKPGGRMVIPVGPPGQVQQLVLVRKDKAGRITSKSLMAVAFVPMTRRPR